MLIPIHFLFGHKIAAHLRLAFRVFKRMEAEDHPDEQDQHDVDKKL